MYFSINGFAVFDTDKLYKSCMQQGIDTSAWLGKANSFVERRGVDPSYGYFLVDHETAQTLATFSGGISNAVTGPPGARRATLRIVSDYLVDESQPYNSQTNPYKEKVIEDLHIESLEQVIPSRKVSETIYLVKLVDARFLFHLQTPFNYRDRWHPTPYINLVAGYLSPTQIQQKYDLVETPEQGEFVYYQEFTKTSNSPRKIGTDSNGKSVYVYTEPFTWEECIMNVIMHAGRSGVVEENHDPIFPYFEGKGNGNSVPGFSKPDWQYELKVPENFEFPEYAPQDIDLVNHSIAEWLYVLLFHADADLIYRGKGKFELVPLKAGVETYNYNGQSITTTHFEKKINDLYLGKTLSDQSGFILGDDADEQGVDQQIYVMQFMKSADADYLDPQRYSEYDFTTVWENIRGEWIYQPSNIPEDKVASISQRVRKVWFPVVYADGLNPVSTDNNQQDDGSQTTQFTTYSIGWFFRQRAKSYWKRRLQYPNNSFVFSGFVFVDLDGDVERVCYFSSSPGNIWKTQIDNILPIRYDYLGYKTKTNYKSQIVVIKGKVTEATTNQTTVPFEFEDSIIGNFVGDKRQSAFNTYSDGFAKDEEIICIKTSSGVYITNLDSPGTIGYDWHILIPKAYSVLRVDSQYATPSANQYTVNLSNVEIVNGKKPFSNTQGAVITVKSSPNTIVAGDGYLYFRYDLTAGDTILKQWTTADAANFKPLLRGIGGYNSGDEDSTVQVIGHYSIPDGASNQCQWEDLGILCTLLQQFDAGNQNLVIGHDGEKAIWRDDVVGSGGSGGGTGGTIGIGGTTTISLCVSSVVGASGVGSSDNPTVNNHISIVGVPPVGAVSAINALGRPYVENEKVFIVSKDGATWYVFKSGVNIVKGKVKTDTLINTKPTVIVQSAYGPSSIVGKEIECLDYPYELSAEDFVTAVQLYNNTWVVISVIQELTGVFITTSQISGSVVAPPNSVTVGSGSAQRCRRLDINSTVYTKAGPSINIYNMVPVRIGINRFVQCKRIGSRWFIDVEACGS